MSANRYPSGDIRSRNMTAARKILDKVNMLIKVLMIKVFL